MASADVRPEPEVLAFGPPQNRLHPDRLGVAGESGCGGRVLGAAEPLARLRDRKDTTEPRQVRSTWLRR
jgi:hypothetical protein